jgi:hypothetical protein
LLILFYRENVRAKEKRNVVIASDRIAMKIGFSAVIQRGGNVACTQISPN